MTIPEAGQFQQLAVWYLQAMRLKIRGSHLICKVATKCLIVPERHCVKSVRIRSYSGPHFPAFGLNTDQNNS